MNDAQHIFYTGVNCMPRGLPVPHEDVVLYALIFVANQKEIHPWEIAKQIVRRPAFMSWVSGNTSSMHYSAMRQFIMLLTEKYGVEFNCDGFWVHGGKYVRARGQHPPAIKANPFAR